MSFIRISSRHSDWGCLFVSIAMIVSTVLICGTIIYVVNHTDPIIEKFSQEAGIILAEVPDLVVETIQRVNNPNLESPEVAKPVEGIYSVKEGDRAYFQIDVEDSTIPTASIPEENLKNPKKEIKIQVLDSSGKEVPPEKGEYLLTCFEKYSVRISDGQSSHTVLLDNLFDKLNTYFKNSKGEAGPVYFPFKDSTSGIQLKATFKGIHRSYMVRSVTIPENTDYRAMPRVRWKSGDVLRSKIVCKLKIIIIQNGSPFFSTVSEVSGWCLDFPVSNNNKFSIREGVGNRYMIQIIHDDQPITELVNLTDLNFNNEIKEDDNQKRWQLIFPGTISMKFEPVK